MCLEIVYQKTHNVNEHISQLDTMNLDSVIIIVRSIFPDKKQYKRGFLNIKMSTDNTNLLLFNMKGKENFNDIIPGPF